MGNSEEKMTLDTLAQMMAKGFSGIDEKFENTASKEVIIELKNEIKDFRKEVSDQFMHVGSQFQKVGSRFDEVREDFSTLQVSVDGYAKKADTYFQEMAAMKNKIDRHETWLKQIAEKVGMKLEY